MSSRRCSSRRKEESRGEKEMPQRVYVYDEEQQEKLPQEDEEFMDHEKVYG